MQDHSDKELLTLFRNSNTRNYAFEMIVRKYQERMYWHVKKIIISHEDTDDILQNTFIKIWKGLENFREDSNLFTWLYKIATNEALNFLKKKKRRSLWSLSDTENNLERELESDPYFNGDELQMKLQKAIVTLPDKQKIVFNMKYFDEMKYEDMAKILDTSVGSLKASYHHAVKKIEKYLNEN